MNELLELIKAFNKDKKVSIIIDYFKSYDAYDAYSIEMREYDYENNTAYHVETLIPVNDLLSAKIPTHEVFVMVLNEMYEQLKRGAKDNG